MSEPHQLSPCCSVSLWQLRQPRLEANALAVETEQRRFEQICARELLGDSD